MSARVRERGGGVFLCCCVAALDLPASAARNTMPRTVRQDDGLELDLRLGSVAVLAREHVDLALVHAELADVRLQKKNVGGLHARVENLRGGELLAVLAAHDRAAARDARHVEAARNVHDAQPVLVGARVDLVAGPEEVDVGHVHARRTPNLDHVAAHSADFLKVAAHLVVQQREPIGHPKLENAARACQLVDVDGLQNTLSNVHSARRFEAIITNGVRSCCQ